MKIKRVILETTMLEEMKFFYTETLEMPLIRDSADFFTVQAGKTFLTFTVAEGEQRFYHVAFRTQLDGFDYFFKKLKDRLLPDEEGRVSMYWKGRQVYFYDPEGNILEILERPSIYENLQSRWQDVCEVGMPVPDTEGYSKWLDRIPNENPPESETFRFYGDRLYGNFVIVKKGRNWYPTGRSAEIHPLTVEIEGGEYALMEHPELPYTIKIKKRWQQSVPAVQMRIARPTNRLVEVVEFYEEGLGLQRVGKFSDHDGYDGVMFGLPDFSYHLEFTQHAMVSPCPAPTKDNLLVFYIPDQEEIAAVIDRLDHLGYKEVEPENPYWKNNKGYTFEDPDGWRVVLFLSAGL